MRSHSAKRALKRPCVKRLQRVALLGGLLLEQHQIPKVGRLVIGQNTTDVLNKASSNLQAQFLFGCGDLTRSQYSLLQCEVNSRYMLFMLQSNLTGIHACLMTLDSQVQVQFK